MQIISAFPIPVSFTTLGEQMRDLNKTLMQDIETEVVVNPQLRSGVNVDQTAPLMENKYDSFKQLSQYVDAACQTFVEKILGSQYLAETESYWANVNKDMCAYHMPHSHTFNGYSFTGVYFPTSGIVKGVPVSDLQNLDDPVELSSRTQPLPGSLVLLDPIEYVKSGVAPATAPRYPFFGSPICLVPKEGALVIFPSYLPHMVTPTREADFTRMSIAFNVKVS